MAKKSAKSKGYRRQNAKKPYLSRRDIALLCLLIVAIGVGAFFLFRYDDGALKVQDGAVVTDGDNWLIANGSNARGGARYYKLGEIGELDGYARETRPLADANLTEYVFTSEDAPVDTVVVTTSHAGAEAMAKYAAGTFADIKNCEVGEVQSAELGGQAVSYFFYGIGEAEPDEAEAEAAPAEEAEAEVSEEASPAEEAEVEVSEEASPAEEAEASEEASPAEDAEEAAEPQYQRALRGYIDADHGCCVVLRCEGSGDAPEDCPTDEQLLAALEKALPVVTLEKSGK